MTRPTRDVFKAISDPSRRQILQLLSKQTHTVNSLVENFRMSRPAVSRHIKILRASGFISMKNVGRQRYCMLRRDGFVDVQRWVDFYGAFWQSKLKNLETLLNHTTEK
jgi:DNA-binding transcriptional ArsR family regulator